MNTVRKIVQSDETGTAHIEVPVAGPRRQVEVVVVWNDLGESMTEWPAGWFEETTGSIDDPSFRRPEQLPVEVREELE
jgi:hypothetical protein